MEQLIDQKLELLAQNRFRSKFHLTHAEQSIEKIQKDAVNIICQRLAPPLPPNDGKQTPFKGHPVFIAQHATATCCRTCLEKWHHISMGRELSKAEIIYVVMVIIKWISRESREKLM